MRRNWPEKTQPQGYQAIFIPGHDNGFQITIAIYMAIQQQWLIQMTMALFSQQWALMELNNAQIGLHGYKTWDNQQ